MRSEERVFATADGELVGEDDPRAAFLRYAVGDEVSEEDAAALKERAKPADKRRARASSKQAGG